ncbi:hypothetical protein ACFSQQ_23840 [Mesorhizobium kowhaii]|uniref:hypothetical protein n=1 Tax=Mesorhizobium kowhaii TaxID=1300272 RepID=UPI0035F02B75
MIYSINSIGNVGAAPHCPAGHFSPYSDGEKEAGRNANALLATLKIGEIIDEGVLLPVHGEKMAAAR